MDPFVVASLGRKTYRTRVIRHNLNPVFDEKMLFQVLPQEQSYSLSFTVVDRDKLSGNDFVGTTNLPLPDVTINAPDADPETGLYQVPEPHDAQTVPPPSKSRLILKNKDRWEAKHNPQLTVKAKYLPYAALRQQFWRVLLKQYDSDENARVSKIELTTMLDTLGSTLKESTINGFFERFAKDNGSQDPSLTFDQAVICLEDQLQQTQKKSLGQSMKGVLNHGHFTMARSSDAKEDNTKDESSVPAIAAEDLGAPGEEGDLVEKDDLVDERGEEHVVEIRECPLCHQPRLNKKSDADIITHIATCASSDWRQVNNIVMAGFVTSSQAQRKWWSKVITKISYGGYNIGANSANILVQDRLTGQINEERMSVYVRLGIRLLYKGLKSRDMEKKRSEF